MEDKIQEIMGLVDSLVASVNGAHLAKREDWRDACFQSADNLIVAIQSKLRELAERCSVREPLSDAEIEKATGVKQGTPMFLAATGFVRATERAHGITNTIKE